MMVANKWPNNIHKRVFDIRKQRNWYSSDRIYIKRDRFDPLFESVFDTVFLSL